MEEDGDLAFAKGEVIQVTEADGEWWKGSIGEKSGTFPSNYVKVIDGDVDIKKSIGEDDKGMDSSASEEVEEGMDGSASEVEAESVESSRRESPSGSESESRSPVPTKIEDVGGGSVDTTSDTESLASETSISHSASNASIVSASRSGSRQSQSKEDNVTGDGSKRNKGGGGGGAKTEDAKLNDRINSSKHVASSGLRKQTAPKKGIAASKGRKPHKVAKKTNFTCIATHPNEDGFLRDELVFRKGDILEILRQVERGVYFGRKEGTLKPVGRIPVELCRRRTEINIVSDLSQEEAALKIQALHRGRFVCSPGVFTS